MAFDFGSYNEQYKRDHYDRMTFNVKKGGRETLRELAESRTGGNVTELILDALRIAYDVDLRK